MLNYTALVLTTTSVISTAACNVAFSRRSGSELLFEVSLAMAVELERLIQRARFQTVPVKAEAAPTSLDDVPAAKATSVSIDSIQIDLATWEHMFRCIFPDDDNNPRIAL